MGEPPSTRTDRLFRALLRAFPFDFRADHGRDMEQTFRTQRRDARRRGEVSAAVRLWVETIRDVISTAPLEHLAILRQDTGYALRSLRRAPIFAASAVLTLAFGMSAMTGMFTVVNAVMLRPLPVDRPEQLISISNRSGFLGLSFLDLQDYRDSSSVLSDAIGYQSRPAALDLGGGAEPVTVEMVTDNYFSMLGVRPALGGLLRPDDERTSGETAVFVLSHAYWRSRLAGDPSVVGRVVELNGRPFTVIGVTSEAFGGTNSLVRVVGWVPLQAFDAFMEVPRASSILEDRGARMLGVLGRLRPGVSLAQAQAALDVRAASLGRDYPSTNEGVSLRVLPETQARPTPEIGPFLRIATTAMLGLAAILLIITSANVAGLLMARAASRGREVALRSALGARQGRIIRQLLTEAVVLAVMSGALAVPIVVAVMRGLHSLIASVSSMVAINPNFSLDFRVLTVTLVTAIVAGVASGMLPAMLACRQDLVTSLRTGGRGSVQGERHGLRSVLIVAQVALSLALLVSGGLFVRALDGARHVDLGFDPDGVVLASTSPGLRGYDQPRRIAFYEAVRARISALPGVSQTAWISFPPLGIVGELAEVSPDGRPADRDWRPPTVYEANIDPGYFETARVGLVMGRTFDARDDAQSKPVVIVNDALAREFWPNRDPIGRILMVDSVAREVVGVVATGKYRNVWEAPQGAVFKPMAQEASALGTVLVRTARPLAEVAPALREAIRQVDPGVAVYDVRPMSVHLEKSAFFIFRVGALITAIFGAMGVLLASIGLYGMLAYHVSQRTNEIGVRMALGARAGDIIHDVLTQGGRLAVTGIVIGIGLASALAYLLRTLLVGVNPFDALTYITVSLLLLLVSLLASFVPARRAIAVDPLAALRSD